MCIRSRPLVGTDMNDVIVKKSGKQLAYDLEEIVAGYEGTIVVLVPRCLVYFLEPRDKVPILINMARDSIWTAT